MMIPSISLWRNRRRKCTLLRGRLSTSLLGFSNMHTLLTGVSSSMCRQVKLFGESEGLFSLSLGGASSQTETSELKTSKRRRSLLLGRIYWIMDLKESSRNQMNLKRSSWLRDCLETRGMISGLRFGFWSPSTFSYSSSASFLLMWKRFLARLKLTKWWMFRKLLLWPFLMLYSCLCFYTYSLKYGETTTSDHHFFTYSQYTYTA